MTQPPTRPEPAGYRLRVTGHLDSHWSAWFGDLTLIHEDDGTTSLTGAVCDQAELHGLLTKIRDLGVTLLSVAVVDPSVPVDHQRDAQDGHEAIAYRAPAASNALTQPPGSKVERMKF